MFGTERYLQAVKVDFGSKYGARVSFHTAILQS